MLLAAVLGVLAVSGSAGAQTADNLGGGVVVGDIVFEEPVRVGGGCQGTDFTFSGESQSVVINTVFTAYAGPVQVTGSGHDGCANGSSQTGTLTVTASGVSPTTGSEFECGTLSGSYVRTLTVATVNVSGACSLNDFPAGDIRFVAETVVVPGRFPMTAAQFLRLPGRSLTVSPRRGGVCTAASPRRAIEIGVSNLASLAPMTGTPADPVTARIADFLTGIGIPVETGRLTDACFLPGIEVRGGGLLVDEERLAYPGDLLHEAGHVATAPGWARVSLSGAVEVPGLDAGELEVAAVPWSFAAARAIGIDPALVFHAGGYRGRGPDILRTFLLGVPVGAHLLEKAGMTATGPRAAALGVPPYPHMLRWLRD